LSDHAFGPGGAFNHRRKSRRAALLVLLASVAMPARSADAAATAATAAVGAAAQQSSNDPNADIIVTAPPLFRDLQPERQLDMDGIASYGVSTIDQLLGEVQGETGDPDDQPLILVNGKRINNVQEIGALPIEALQALQMLPRGSAVRLGGRSGQRVVSLTLHRKFIAETLTAAGKIATEGNWHSKRGEAIFTRIRGDTRANVTLRGRSDSRLLESERDIIQPITSLPYALGGNVIAFPTNLSGEIDPLLSAAAGRIVTVAPVPSQSAPTLTDFVAGANQAAVSDLGQFRTLRPDTRNFDFNGNFATPIAPWLTASATLHIGRTTTEGLRGLSTLEFILPASNPASPFSRDVGLAYYGANPLAYRTRHSGEDGNLTLNAEFGAWTGNFNARHSRAKDVSVNDRQSNSSSLRLDNSVDPFTADLGNFFTVQEDRVTSRTVTTLAELSLTGPLATLPAGPLQTTLEATAEWDRLRGSSTFSVFDNRDIRRSDQGVRGAVAIPITSRDAGFGAAIGNLDATAEYGRAHYSDAGSLSKYAVSLAWEPRPILRLFGSLEGSETPVPISTLGSPIITTPGVRVFDPLTGETVDVTQVTGGNPGLKPQKTTIRRLTGLLRVLPKLSLQLNAEYTDTNRRNFVSSLPEASAAIMLAFPDRYVRDANGVLTTIDLRPVNFESDREKRLRWGFSMNTKIAGAASRPVAPGLDRPVARSSTYLQVTFNHTMVFSERIFIRPGLDPIDLLGGGAIGIGGGRLRHQVDGTAAVTSGGLGVRVGVGWRGPSRLLSRANGVTDTLHFSPTMLVNTRVFADMRRFLPHSDWAKGFRISLDVLNLTNDRQEVRDSLGNTPLQYQPGYRDPIGRTVEIELRKVF
jgi:hypothetical protein